MPLALRLAPLAIAAVVAAACAAPLPSPSAAVAPSGAPAATPALTPPAGTTGSPPPTGTPTPIQAPALEGSLTCGAPDLEFPADALGHPAGAELGQDAPAAALRAYLAARAADGESVPRTGWRVVIAEPKRVVYLAPDGSAWAMASFILADDGTWEDWDQGACGLAVVLPDGVGFAEWNLDPAQAPDPSGTAVHLLAHELACAGGKAPLGRLLAPIVMVSDDAITIAIAVRTRPGGQDCPGNPEFPIEVDLAAPLGTRRLFDGSTVPPTERRPGAPSAVVTIRDPDGDVVEVHVADPGGLAMVVRVADAAELRAGADALDDGSDVGAAVVKGIVVVAWAGTVCDTGLRLAIAGAADRPSVTLSPDPRPACDLGRVLRGVVIEPRAGTPAFVDARLEPDTLLGG